MGRGLCGLIVKSLPARSQPWFSPCYTVSLDIFAQNTVIFVQFALTICMGPAEKYDVSEKNNHTSSKRINCCLRENLAIRKCLIWLDARKFSSAKTSTFTVYRPMYICFLTCSLIRYSYAPIIAGNVDSKDSRDSIF